MRRTFLAGTLVFFVSHPAFARTVAVSDAAGLTTAISAAAPGDEIVLASGTYPLASSPVCGTAGTGAAPIVVRSATPLGAKVEFDAVEGFHVTAPHWHFEGLDVHGVCADDSNCEHGFHVTGAASGFVLRNSRIVDFNAQLKVNADKPVATWLQPNGGLVENNEVFDTHARATSHPVTKLNIDGVDGWIVRANFIHDAHKNGGDDTSYQSFMKGGGKNGLYERNLVICSKDDTTGGTRIGLSFGGGGTAPAFCAPAFDAAVPCVPEMTASTIKNNVIVDCSDVAVYLNQSKDSKVLYNTMIATNGVDFRFASTSGEADGNVLASAIRTRDGAVMTSKTNLGGLTPADFDAFYAGPHAGDLRKKGDLSRLLGKGTARPDVLDDYCTRTRSGAYDLGALQSSLGDCATTSPPPPPKASDAGAPSAADPSASSPDAPGGATMDAGAATTAAPASSSSGGCACSAAARGQTRSLAVLGLLFAFAAMRRRRVDTPRARR